MGAHFFCSEVSKEELEEMPELVTKKPKMWESPQRKELTNKFIDSECEKSKDWNFMNLMQRNVKINLREATIIDARATFSLFCNPKFVRNAEKALKCTNVRTNAGS